MATVTATSCDCRASLCGVWPREQTEVFVGRSVHFPSASPSPSVICVLVFRENRIMIGATSLVCGGRYALDALFGDEEDAIGAQGIVYKASETSTGRLVAVKVFKHSAEEAKREHEMGIRCRHPNIIEFLEFDRLSKKAIVMRRLSAAVSSTPRSKNSRCTRSGPSPFLEQLVAACDMHEVCGVAHLDVKLENCLLTDHATLKLADFGFATEHTSPSPAQDRRGARLSVARNVSPRARNGAGL